MSGLIAPPPPKVRVAKTIPKSNKYYTIHSQPKSMFGVRVDDDAATFMVGFKKQNDAMLMGRMLETYYINNQELPLPGLVTEFTLPTADESIQELKHLFLLHNDANNLFAWCTVNFLNFLGVEEIVENSGKYSWDVTMYAPEPDFEMYRERFDFLYEL